MLSIIDGALQRSRQIQMEQRFLHTMHHNLLIRRSERSSLELFVTGRSSSRLLDISVLGVCPAQLFTILLPLSLICGTVETAHICNGEDGLPAVTLADWM